VADYLAKTCPTVRDTNPEIMQGTPRRVSSPLVGEEQGGGSHRHPQQASGGAFDNLLGPRDPPPLPAPTRGGGCAHDIYPLRHRLTRLVDVARLENAWVEAYHAEDASVATVGELAALSPDCLPGTRIAFHPATRLIHFATPAASLWASAQCSSGPAAPADEIGEDALITRPDCDVRVRVLPPLGYDFALRLREGANLLEAAHALDDPAFDFGAHLVGLIDSGAVASIIPGQLS
jgi:hypothetical protein